jgi:lipid-A-disaccharide synthase
MRTGDPSVRSLRVAIVAGEASGDTLGAGLIGALRRRAPEAEFFGIAGERMRAAGCAAWHGAEELSVMGLAEVLRHLPRLVRLRRKLIERIERRRPDVFIGIDSPDFNLPVAAALKRTGIPTVQYVSPQVWAWRQSRVTGIRSAVDLVLCVLPFEADFYTEHGVRAQFVGHPLADAIPPSIDAATAKRALGFDGKRPLVALLPGSRRSEVKRLALPFMQTAAWLQQRRPLDIAVALASEGVGAEFRAATAGMLEQSELRERPALWERPPAANEMWERPPAAIKHHSRRDAAPTLVVGRAREVMAAADAVLTASGTASLEALLLKRPMVVAYRMAPMSYWLFRRLGVARLPHFSLPNLLAGRRLVAEYVQNQVRPDVLGPAVLDCLDGRMPDPDWRAQFDAIHARLRCGADEAAAVAVLDLLQTGRAAAC